MNTLGATYLDSAIKRFLTYKTLGDMTFAQLEEKDFYFVPWIVPSNNIVRSRERANDGPSAATERSEGCERGEARDEASAMFLPASPVPSEESNNIAVIIQHMHGNMLSRWTDFLTTDGEKEGRNRDEEFNPPTCSKAQLLTLWEDGWRCLIDTLRSLKDDDLLKTITIRHEPLVVIDAINRQLAHYPHHVGQIVYLEKMIRDHNWQSLSIKKGASGSFNKNMQERHKR